MSKTVSFGVPITGELDIVSDVLSASPGSLKSCLNYEVGVQRGATRMDGFSRTDGRVLTGDLTDYYYFTPSAPSDIAVSGSFLPGDLLTFSPFSGTGEITATLAYYNSATKTLYITNASATPPPSLLFLVSSSSGGSMTNPSGLGAPIVFFSFGTLADDAASQATVAAAIAASVTQLPGNSLCRTPGLHFFKDRIYAVRDLVAISVAPTTTTLIVEGAALALTSGGAMFGRIAKVTPGTTSTDLTLHLFDFVTGTSLPSGQDIYVDTTKIGDYSSTNSASLRSDFATLYYADYNGAGGWTRVDLGRFLQYDEGTGSDAAAFFLPYNRGGFQDQIDATLVDDTGWIFAQSWDQIGGGNVGWTGSQTDLTADDAAVVSSGTLSTGHFTRTLRAKFGSLLETAIPAGAQIRGFQIQIHRKQDNAAGLTKDQVVALCKDTFLGANLANTALTYPSALTTASYGPSAAPYMMGGLTWSSAEVRGTDFGVCLQVLQGANRNVDVDSIQIKVYYQQQTKFAYIRNATAGTDLEIEVIHYTVAEGSATGDADGTRKGVLVVNGVATNAAKATLIAPGMRIRTQTGGGGDILADVASVDEPILLPSSAALEEEESRYVFHTASPYAQDGSEVVFICSGAGQAYMFDQQYALPIQTSLKEQYEKPRHVAWTGVYLALGYRTGALAFSESGDPLTFLGESSDAAAIGAGDRITALFRMKGDSLGVGTETTVFALQGSIPAEFQRTYISTDSGLIEHSYAAMGQPTYLDFYGASNVETTNAYGNFNTGRLSAAITPYLIERLQSDRNTQTVDRRFVGSLAVRGKNQKRDYFADGRVVTMTLQEGVARFTTQHLYGDYTDRDDTAIKPLALCSGTTSSGKDVAFMTFDADPDQSRFGYVFQIDAGRSFDGEPIVAQLMLQPNGFKSPFVSKHLQQIGIHGKAYGLANLNLFCAADYTDPVSDESNTSPYTGGGYRLTLGDAAYDTTTQKDMKAIKDLRCSGEDFTLLIESISASELPHVIQMVMFRYEDLKEHN